MAGHAAPDLLGPSPSLPSGQTHEAFQHADAGNPAVRVALQAATVARWAWRTPSTTSYQLNGNLSGMRTTIDKAGRLVVPKALRDQAGITAGEVELSLDGAAIRVESVAGEELVEQDGLLLLPSGGPELDSDEVRELRLADQK